jgi:hypothetical protein
MVGCIHCEAAARLPWPTPLLAGPTTGPRAGVPCPSCTRVPCPHAAAPLQAAGPLPLPWSLPRDHRYGTWLAAPPLPKGAHSSGPCSSSATYLCHRGCINSQSKSPIRCAPNCAPKSTPHMAGAYKSTTSYTSGQSITIPCTNVHGTGRYSPPYYILSSLTQIGIPQQFLEPGPR